MAEVRHLTMEKIEAFDRDAKRERSMVFLRVLGTHEGKLDFSRPTFANMAGCCEFTVRADDRCESGDGTMFVGVNVHHAGCGIWLMGYAVEDEIEDVCARLGVDWRVEDKRGGHVK